MSVINKMLRDLDARRMQGALPDHPRLGQPTVMDGTLSVQTRALDRVRRLPARLCLLGLLAAALLLFAYDRWATPAPETVPTLAVPVAVPVPAAPEPAAAASEPLAVSSAGADLATSTVTGPTVVNAPLSGRGSGTVPSESVPRKSPDPEVVAANNVAVNVPRSSEPSRVQAVAPSRPQTAVATGAPVAVATPIRAPTTTASAPADAGGPAQRRQTAAQETLVQAQALWAAGSREAALELVREAVAVLERAPPLDAHVLAPLVREQVRMELALGRPESVLAVLSRLEPALASQADLWAVRGNAAQRLGRHPEAVTAYQSALQLRPGEARWMLGAAVSQAALGQLDAAAQLAEQARALGPVSPEVLAYLRQAGVPLR